jgi:EAL domain-containing protein (putative c-di-GMP-specific phosphodiesterase class I)
MKTPGSLGLPRVEFGRRRIAPHACIVDSKAHVRTFLAESLEELGFIPRECSTPVEVAAALNAMMPDLVLIVVSSGPARGEDVLGTLAAGAFLGRVLLVGGRSSPMLAGLQREGERQGLAMLPVLATPFRARDLKERLLELLPAGERPRLPVDLVAALANNWLELWYQLRIDPRSLLPRGVEALIRLRHPTWGVGPPADFLPDPADPHMTALSEFVITRAIADWMHFTTESVPVEIAIGLPGAVLHDPQFVSRVHSKLPNHPAFSGLVLEINGAELFGTAARVDELARDLGRCNVGISIDNLGADCASLTGIRDFPFVEIKVDRSFVNGCANDRLKRAACGTILDTARRFGVRTVASGVETRADLLAARELGFDLVQGSLFGMPMEARRFARTLLRRSITLPSP